MNRGAPHHGIARRAWLAFLIVDPRAGHEQPRRRPALILSPESYNGRVGLAILCPITSQQTGYPFEVAMPLGSAVQGVILSDQAKNLDWRARPADLIEPLPPHVTQEVLQKLGILLG